MEGEQAKFDEIMNRIGKGLDTHTVFGEPQQVDGSAIIPVAKIRYGGGGGFGGAEGEPSERKPGARGPAGAGEGMGMGFGVSAEPLGVVQVTHGSVEWIPIVDRSRLAMVWSIVTGLVLVMLVGRVFSRR
jgi:uncharacterized spore protein YtfJ